MSFFLSFEYCAYVSVTGVVIVPIIEYLTINNVVFLNLCDSYCDSEN